MFYRHQYLANCIFASLYLAGLVIAQGANSDCYFSSTVCSCSQASGDGECLDLVSPGLCTIRPCNSGWGCDCEGEFFCQRKPSAVLRIANTANAGDNLIACEVIENESVVSSPGSRSGAFFPLISKTGFSNDPRRCSDWLWYYNGEEDGDFTGFKNDGDGAASDYDSLTKWLNLPLQSGDVIAHRFKAEWKECYAGSDLAVNGAISNTNDPTRFRHVYSNSFSADWYKQSFDDSSWNAQDLPFGADSWNDDTSTGKLESTKTNTYWRITVL